MTSHRLIPCILSAILLSHPALAALPTLRPLPTRIIEGNQDWWIHRDDEVHNHFYLSPRILKVTKQSMASDQYKDLSCELVTNYYKSLNSIAETLYNLAETARVRSAQLMRELQEKRDSIDALTKKRSEVELERQSAEQKADSAKAKTLGDELAALSAKEKQLTEEMAVVDQKRKQINLEIASIDLEIAKRRTSLESLRQQVDEPVGWLNITLEAPGDLLRDRQSLETLGLKADSDLVAASEIIALELSPNLKKEEGESNDDASSTISDNRPSIQWTVQPLSYPKSFLDLEHYGKEIKPRDFPKRIDFKRRLTLRNYCQIQSRQIDLTKHLIEALNISYEIPIWSDSGSARLNGARIFGHSLRLTALSAEALSAFVVANPNGSEFNPQDLGDPLRFSGEGKLAAQPIFTDIKMAIAKE